MLDGIEVQLNTNFFDNVEEYKKNCKKIIYTGALDEYFNYSLGHLEYRSLKFDTKIFDCENYQGNAVVNYTGTEVDYTRVIEHKHFEGANSPKSVVTFEYPSDYEEGMEKYYTINDEKNNELSIKYKELAEKEKNVIFVGRLAEYKYYDMDDVIKRAFEIVENEQFDNVMQIVYQKPLKYLNNDKSLYDDKGNNGKQVILKKELQYV